MASIVVQSVEDGQFDDPTELPTNETRDNSRQGPRYIDDDLLEWSEESTPEEDEEIDEEVYSDNRVEDEDWEIAERGTHLHVLLSGI